MTDKPKTLSIKNPVLRAYLRRLVRTGVYGGRETEAAWRLLNDQLDYLIDSGKLKRLEDDAKFTLDTDKPAETDNDEETTTD